MDVIGRIGNTVYLHLAGARGLSKATLFDCSDLEYIDEYSSEYFIELAAIGESQFEETEPVTREDRFVYNKRIMDDE